MTMIQSLNPEIFSRADPAHAKLPHVLLVVDQLGETLGGGERIALKLAALLPQYGYRASVLTFFAHPETAALLSAPCPVYLLPLQRTYDLTALRAGFELRRFLREQRVQIVQTFFESSDLWAGLITKTMSTAKLIWSRRDMGILRTRKHSAAYRLLAGMPDAVFAVSEQVRQHCIEVDRIDPRRVQTIYNGLDVAGWDMRSSMDAHQRQTNHVVIATVGNVRRVKGHDLFIHAAATVVRQFPEVSFTIAGEVLEPDYFAELQNLIRDSKLTNHLRFVGNIADMRKHLSDADIFVLPSRSEGFSNAIVEAMAASLPIIATNVGGNAEAVEDGVNGFLVPPEDPASISAAILRLLANPSQAKKLGAKGKELALAKFTTEAMMSRIIRAYAKLMGTKSN